MITRLCSQSSADKTELSKYPAIWLPEFWCQSNTYQNITYLNICFKNQKIINKIIENMWKYRINWIFYYLRVFLINCDGNEPVFFNLVGIVFELDDRVQWDVQIRDILPFMVLEIAVQTSQDCLMRNLNNITKFQIIINPLKIRLLFPFSFFTLTNVKSEKHYKNSNYNRFLKNPFIIPVSQFSHFPLCLQL